MNYNEFKRRVAYNTEVLKDALESDIPLTAILHKVYTWKYDPGEAHTHILMRNAHDITPSLFLGVLASCESNGIDAYEVKPNGDVIDIEIKTSESNSNKMWQGVGGGLYTGLQNTETRRVSVASGMAAAYTCHSEKNKLSKNMRTIFMITDTAGANTYIDAYELSGDVVIEYLYRSDCKTRSIKFGSFLKSGFKTKTVVDLEGYYTWKWRILDKAPVVILNDYPTF